MPFSTELEDHFQDAIASAMNLTKEGVIFCADLHVGSRC